MKGNELVSVIVPVFNTEKYLRECLDSLKNQSYSNLEVIMVNDGSTDHSPEICKEYCRADKRFILIEQDNSGLGMARNSGLARATGQYVCFVDSDDFVHEKYVEILYENLLNYHVDISMCGYLKFQEGESVAGNIVNICHKKSKLQLLYDVTTTGPDNCSEKVVISWNKLIPMKIMKQLRFLNKLHEDEFMINELLLKISDAVCTNAALYFYRQHSNSITGTKNQTNIRHLDALDAVYERITLFSGEEYQKIFPDILRSYFENSAAIYYRLASNHKLKLIKNIYPRYFRMLMEHRNKLTVKQFLRYLLFLFSPNYYRRKYWS